MKKIVLLALIVLSLIFAGCSQSLVDNNVAADELAAESTFSSDLNAVKSSTSVNQNVKMSQMANGVVKYEITLPSDQNYVELFVRQNGLQNVAQNITASQVYNGDGTSTYSYEKDGYTNGDTIEYRFYSFLPGQPGLFTPGPAGDIWIQAQYNCLNTDDGLIIMGEQLDASGDEVTLEAVYTNSLSWIQTTYKGWFLHRACPGTVTVPLLKDDAEVVGIYAKRAGENYYINLNRTPYLNTISTDVNNNEITVSVAYRPTEWNGGIDTTYCEDWIWIKVPSSYGQYIWIKTDGKVTFAFVIKHK